MTNVSGLPDSSKLDGHASAKEKTQCTMWKAHTTSTLGDLLAGVNLLNHWTQFDILSGVFILFVHKLLEARPPTLAKIMSIPQRHYIQNRVRELHKPRLETVRLWPTESKIPSDKSNLGASPLDKPPPTKDKKISRNVFALEQVRLDYPFTLALCAQKCARL